MLQSILVYAQLDDCPLIIINGPLNGRNLTYDDLQVMHQQEQSVQRTATDDRDIEILFAHPYFTVARTLLLFFFMIIPPDTELKFFCTSDPFSSPSSAKNEGT